MRPGPRRPSRLRGTLLTGVVLGVAYATPGTAPAAALPTPALAAAHAYSTDRTAARAACSRPDRPFTPTRLAIPGVLGRTRVLALGRDQRGVPRPPPLTDRGKWQFAWDKASRIRPGSRHGVVRLTAHTYPRFAGTALGNLLLGRLRVGALMVVTGPQGRLLCYRVSRRLSVPAHRTLPSYYSSAGRPRLAILVCSGTRRGPGDWSHRTVWFAVPVTDGRA